VLTGRRNLRAGGVGEGKAEQEMRRGGKFRAVRSSSMWSLKRRIGGPPGGEVQNKKKRLKYM